MSIMGKWDRERVKHAEVVSNPDFLKLMKRGEQFHAVFAKDGKTVLSVDVKRFFIAEPTLVENIFEDQINIDLSNKLVGCAVVDIWNEEGNMEKQIFCDKDIEKNFPKTEFS